MCGPGLALGPQSGARTRAPSGNGARTQPVAGASPQPVARIRAHVGPRLRPCLRTGTGFSDAKLKGFCKQNPRPKLCGHPALTRATDVPRTEMNHFPSWFHASSTRMRHPQTLSTRAQTLAVSPRQPEHLPTPSCRVVNPETLNRHSPDPLDSKDKPPVDISKDPGARALCIQHPCPSNNRATGDRKAEGGSRWLSTDGEHTAGRARTDPRAWGDWKGLRVRPVSVPRVPLCSLQ